jgi:hypothetical protein
VCSERAIPYDVMLYGTCAGDVRQRWETVTTASVDSPLPGDDDVLRGARIREVSQAVFPASQLGALVGYIRRPFSAQLVHDQGSPWFSSVLEQMLSWYPEFHVVLHASHAALPLVM